MSEALKATPAEALAFILARGDEIAATAVGGLAEEGRGCVTAYKGRGGWVVGWRGMAMLAEVAGRADAHPMHAAAVAEAEEYDPHREVVAIVFVGGGECMMLRLRLAAVIDQEAIGEMATAFERTFDA